MKLDGELEEPVWATADSITDFYQKEPREGVKASERTVVRLIGNKDGFWVGLWAYEAEPPEIRQTEMRRDAELRPDDNFSLMIDAQHDRRSGFLFSVNSNGAMRDSEILDFQTENTDWNGVWDVRAHRTNFGWQAELFIPWQTLRYPAGSTEWGLNIGRFVRHLNEETLWRSWRRPEGMMFLEREGTLVGMRDLPPRAVAEVRPYVSTTAHLAQRGFLPSGADTIAAGGGASATAGLDVKLAPTPTLTLDLTANTDFAQAEVDNQVVNLTRFPLFFPEQRTFFTEGAGIFDFGRPGQTQLFYSRRIGLDASRATIPLIAGARLNGRVGAQQVGLLAVRTGGALPQTSIVARVKRDVLRRGYVGAMATLQLSQGRPLSPAAGADFYFPYIINGQNLLVSGDFAIQQDSARGNAASHTRFKVDYPNDKLDIGLRYDRVGTGFAPPLGFVSQAGINRFGGQFRFAPRPGRFGIRQLDLGINSVNVVTNLDNSLDNADFVFRMLGMKFEKGGFLNFDLKRNRDDPTAAFDIFTGSTVRAGSYQWDRVEVGFRSSRSLPVPLTFDFTVSSGGFYDGNSRSALFTLGARMAPHLVANLDYQLDDVHRAKGSFTANTLRARIDVASNARLVTTLLGQYDNKSRRVALNARLRWTRSPGSDAFVVWNSGWPSGFAGGVPWGRPESGTLIVKVVEYFRR